MVDNHSIVLSSALTADRGFHTTSVTRLSLAPSSPSPSCSLHQLYTLPSLLFADPYELYHYASSYAFSLYGPHNLELPVFAIDEEQSLLLLDITLPEPAAEEAVLEVTVPLHLRYGMPTAEKDRMFVDITLPPPTAFWACEAASSAPIPPLLQSLANTSAFTNRHVSFSILPGADHAALLPQTVRVPVGQLKDVAFVEFSTVAVVLLCLVYLVRVALRSRSSRIVDLKRE